MKRKILLLCLVAMLLALVSVGTYSNAVYTKKTKNVITTGSVDIMLHEKTASGEDYPNEPVVIMPGDVVSKQVTVENTGKGPAYVRVKLTPGINAENLTAADCIRMDIDTANWSLQDGYYYYNKVLLPGSTTPALFTQVTFVGEKVTNAYLGKMFTLDVAAYAVQSANNGNNPLAALGWPGT